MPMYTYKCLNKHRFDEIRPIADRDKPVACPVEIQTKIFDMGTASGTSTISSQCMAVAHRIEIPVATTFVPKIGVGDRSPFSRDREGK